MCDIYDCSFSLSFNSSLTSWDKSDSTNEHKNFCVRCAMKITHILTCDREKGSSLPDNWPCYLYVIPWIQCGFSKWHNKIFNSTTITIIIIISIYYVPFLKIALELKLLLKKICKFSYIYWLTTHKPHNFY